MTVHFSQRRQQQQQLGLIGELSQVLGDAAVGFWLAGGWAVDFHAGRVTRSHSDIDLIVDSADRGRLAQALGSLGFSPRPGDNPDGVVQYDGNGDVVEVTFVTRSATGRLVTPGYESWPWDEDSFPDVEVGFAGLSVRALSVAALLTQKCGWQEQLGEAPRPHDVRDIETLSGLAAGVGAGT